MGLTVYQLEHSPYCIPITQALQALGVGFSVKNVSNADRREVLEISNGRYYQVPLLTHDGEIIYESAPDSIDIARYVDKRFAGGRLFPEKLEGLQRILISHIENDIEGITFRLTDPFYLKTISDPIEKALILRHKERKFGPGCVDQWEAQRSELLAKTEALLAPFDLMLQQGPFLLGEVPIFTDYALSGIIGNFTYKGHNEIPPALRALAEWHRRLQEYRYT
jgi:glutathione S-transferase